MVAAESLHDRVAERLRAGATPKFCRTRLKDQESKSQDQAYRIARKAVAASGKKSFLDEAIDQLKSGMPAKACFAWLTHDKGFTRKQAKQIVRKALAGAGCTNLAAARKMHMQSAIDQLKSGVSAKACRAVLVRNKDFTHKRAKRIVRKALAGAGCTDLTAARKMHTQAAIDQLNSGVSAKACRAALVRDKGFTHKQAKLIARKALAGAGCTDLVAARKMHLQAAIDQLKSGVPAEACRTWLTHGNGFTHEQARRTVRKALAEAEFTDLAAARQVAAAEVIADLRADVTPGACRAMLRRKGWTIEQSKIIARQAAMRTSGRLRARG